MYKNINYNMKNDNIDNLNNHLLSNQENEDLNEHSLYELALLHFKLENYESAINYANEALGKSNFQCEDCIIIIVNSLNEQIKMDEFNISLINRIYEIIEKGIQFMPNSKKLIELRTMFGLE